MRVPASFVGLQLNNKFLVFSRICGRFRRVLDFHFHTVVQFGIAGGDHVFAVFDAIKDFVAVAHSAAKSDFGVCDLAVFVNVDVAVSGALLLDDAVVGNYDAGVGAVVHGDAGVHPRTNLAVAVR